MNPTAIRAVTFDLWDTILVNDSDEPKRKAQGLLPKKIERRSLVHRFLSRHGSIGPEAVKRAYDHVDQEFNQSWHQRHITWPVTEHLERLLAALGRTLPREELDELVCLHEEMELEVRPDLAPGAAQALRELGRDYRLGVISDTVFSPGRVLREILAAEGLSELFDAFAFSDEVGRAKPDPAIFQAAADRLGVTPAGIVHVGDRESNDVAGPQAVGARAVLVTVVKDRGSGKTRADAVCDDFSNLYRIISSLDSP